MYFLIKKRFPTDHDQEPPLFPWETSVEDYGEDVAELAANGNDKPEPLVAGEPPADE